MPSSSSPSPLSCSAAWDRWRVRLSADFWSEWWRVSRASSSGIARPDRYLRHLHSGSAVPPERPVRGTGMSGPSLARILLVAIALLAIVPLLTTSNAVLNFLVVALMIALVGQGWNVLGGYGGQYSFGHAAFFGTGAYVTAILQVRYGAQCLGRFHGRHRSGAALVGALIGAITFRSGLTGLLFCAGHARVRRGAAHSRQRRADHRSGRRHACRARPAATIIPVSKPRAVLLDHAYAARGVAHCRAYDRGQPLRCLARCRARK